MAGHSKWSNIKHRKAAQDAQRGKIFTKLIRELVVSAREGGSDPETNPRLRAAIDKSLSNNMKRDTIDNAVARGAGELDTDDMEEIRYEGYGQGGVAIMVECMSNNRNRTAGDVRHAFTKNGGNLGTDGSVAYMFTKLGVLSFAPGADEDGIMEAALEGGANDVITNDDGSVDVYTEPEHFGAVVDAMKAAGFEPDNAEVTQVASTEVELDLEAAKSIVKLIDMMEELDDVQEVHHNADIPPEAYD